MFQRLKPRTLSKARTTFEILEDRCLLSASHHAAPVVNSILFSLAPVAVQTGLDNLATTDSLTLPTTSQTVLLGNKAGVETYTVDITGNGINSALTVDVNGKAYTAPASSTTTFGAVTNTAVTSEFSALATALSLTAPVSTDTVKVLTASDGTQTFSFTFASSTGHRGKTYAVDASGNPVGNVQLPLSVFSKTISNALTAAQPVGAAALTSSSLVAVKTQNGVTTYSATYRATGITTTVTVDNTGKLTNLPTTSVVQFATIPTAAQTELQTLAAANGYTGTISTTQNVKAYDEANGTVIYTVSLPVTKTGSSGSTFTFTIQLAADQAGNPTVPPSDGGGGGGDGCFGWFGGGFGGFGQFGGPGGDLGDGGPTGTGGTTGSTSPSGLSRGFRF